jgi:hypothetical protein
LLLLLHFLAWDTTGIPGSQEEATQAWEVARATVVHAGKASARENVVAWENTVALIKEVHDWATLAEREACERVSRMEVENATALASTRGEAEVLPRRVALLEGELAEAP